MSETPVEPTPEPTLAAESITTQHGLQYPNGEIDWADTDGNIKMSNGGAWQLFNIDAPGPDLTAFLAQRAHNARLDPELYVESHKVMARTVTTLVSAPFPAEAPAAP